MRAFLKNLLHIVGQRHADRMSAGGEESSAPAIVRSEFARWCVPRRGQLNAENQTNSVWVWLAETCLWPHSAHELAGSGRKQEPGWCFSRYGQSKTSLEDGRTVYIGGEHEDFYDPDFYIYNDVVVKNVDGSIAIYGYPREIFQPTDFHTATTVENCIYIIGCLGYVKDRRPKDTPVYLLNLQSFQISTVETTGEAPSWLFKHTARYETKTHSIVLEGGEVIEGSANDMVPNDCVWELSLRTFEWKKC